MPKQILLFCLAIAATLGGCANDIARTPAGTAATKDYVYRLGADDRVRITVYGEPTLSGEYAVNTEGQISFPLVGMFKAGGLTISELTTQLTAALGNGYYKNPHLVVDMVAYRPVYVLGEVNKAGQYPYVAGMTVLGAVASAGGFTYRANQKTVMIRHNGATTEDRSPLTANLIVYPGDTIRIRERYF
jgi:protein involved in polysaccharide export with SLBB domain